MMISTCEVYTLVDELMDVARMRAWFEHAEEDGGRGGELGKDSRVEDDELGDDPWSELLRSARSYRRSTEDLLTQVERFDQALDEFDESLARALEATERTLESALSLRQTLSERGRVLNDLYDLSEEHPMSVGRAINRRRPWEDDLD